MAALETTSGPLQLDTQKNTTTPPGTVHVPPILVQLHLCLWERIFSVRLGDLGKLKANGTLMTLCGTHRGVRRTAPAVIVVVRGSLLVSTRVMTLK